MARHNCAPAAESEKRLRIRCAAWNLAAVLTTIPACSPAPAVPEVRRVRMVSQRTSETVLGLMAVYNRSIDRVSASADALAGSALIVADLQRGRAEIGFAQADVVYAGFRTGINGDHSPYTNLRAIAVGGRASINIAVRRDSAITGIADLRHARIGVQPPGGSGAVYMRMVLEGYGIDETDVVLVPTTRDEMAEKLEDGTLDAAAFMQTVIRPELLRVHERVGVRILGLSSEVMTRLRGRYPFLIPEVVRASSIPGLDGDVDTVGVESVLICRADLDDDLVYHLTRGWFTYLEQSGEGNPGTELDLTNPSEASATPIPLHPGAARYYREREILH
jgi:TRAP transporter TAXI family solute receptor